MNTQRESVNARKREMGYRKHSETDHRRCKNCRSIRKPSALFRCSKISLDAHPSFKIIISYVCDRWEPK